MRRILDYIFAIVVICVIFMSIDYFSNTQPQYKVNECTKDQIHGNIRKVVVVKDWVYNYCKMRDNKCSKKKFSMRIKDFDRIMKLVKCPEVK